MAMLELFVCLFVCLFVVGGGVVVIVVVVAAIHTCGRLHHL